MIHNPPKKKKKNQGSSCIDASDKREAIIKVCLLVIAEDRYRYRIKKESSGKMEDRNWQKAIPYIQDINIHYKHL